MHTSTVTVCILEGPPAGETIYDRRSKDDFSYRWFGATGAGGQHANRHHNSLDLTHVPTGLSVKAQGRSRPTNERYAMEGLLAKLDAMKTGVGLEQENIIRSAQVGAGMRADKRRTYRFRDDAIVDHVNDRTTTCSMFMKGNIDRLWRN